MICSTSEHKVFAINFAVSFNARAVEEVPRET